tara:strand:- start:216 stop:707 length:492 start_codon:yes stop_codon:yes gene_type:complete
MNPYAKPESTQPANPFAKASAYKSTSVNTSSPADLVLMLYDGILRFLNNARSGFSIKDPVEYHQVINQNLQKAQAIIRELRSCLEVDKASGFGDTMAGLYDYFDRRLQEANMEKTIEPIDEIYDRVTIIRNAWDEMVQRELKNETPVQQPDPSSEVGTLDLSG